jgi:enamine deaminase RidA (YjgF/YER057c/UK114 family)
MRERRLISGGSPWEPRLGYSRAVVQGDWCFVSGTTGLDPVTRAFPPSAAEQARVAFGNIATALDKAGFAFADVVRATYILTEVAYMAEIAPVLAEVFGEVRPAATMMIAGLVSPEMKVEIELTAFRG